MLLELIEHQKELFTAIIGAVNYRDLSALRVTCKALFDVISSDHHWQHMRDFAASLRQINSIQRVILMDPFYDGMITIICNRGNITYYIASSSYPILEIYSIKYSSRHNIDNVIECYSLDLLIISNFRNSDTVPKWLLECMDKIISKNDRLTEILDIRP